MLGSRTADLLRIHGTDDKDTLGKRAGQAGPARTLGPDPGVPQID